MPFIVPKVSSFNESATVVVVQARADPTPDQIASFIRWLDEERAAAIGAWEAKTDRSWADTPAEEGGPISLPKA